jgi:hypothetical protein
MMAARIPRLGNLPSAVRCIFLRSVRTVSSERGKASSEVLASRRTPIDMAYSYVQDFCQVRASAAAFAF